MRYLNLFLFLLPFFPLSATTYYLDATGGSNANDGLSPSTAWKDLFKIRSGAGPQPGDVYLFKRGESWSGTQLYITASGTAGNPIRYDAYGTGPLPVLTVLTPIETADDPANWAQRDANTWYLSLARSPGRLFLDGTEYLRSSTLATLGQADNEGAAGRWFHADGRLYISTSQNPALSFSTITGSKFFNSVLVFGASHLEILNLDVRGGTGGALSVNGGTDIRVASCSLGRSANSGLTLIDAALSDGITPSARVIVEQNTFDSNFNFFYGLGSERGCGDGIKLFHGVNNCIVRNNTFRNWAHNAIELLGSQAGSSGVNNNLIHDNTISAPDIPYAHPMGADGLLGRCQFNEFYRNYISDCRTSSQINGNDNWVHHNIIVGMRRSPSKTQATAHAFSLGIYGTGLVSQNNRFDHNLIIDTDESAFLIRGYGLPGQAFGHQIRNNIFYETGLAPYQNAYQAGTGIVIFDTADDGLGPNTYQNNLFYSATTTNRAVFTRDDATYHSASDFNAMNGTDGNTISGNLSADPQFIDFNGEDYFPSETSPVIDVGVVTGLTLDFNQNSRTVGSAPDIGPYEKAITALPVNWETFTVTKNTPKTLLLRWSTYAEINAAEFLIERSKDGIRWQSIKVVPATGNGNSRTNYRFEDRPPGPGTWHYRLRQLDHDGRQSFSPIRRGELDGAPKVSLARLDGQTIRVMTTPSTDWSAAYFKVYDSLGRLLLHQVGDPVISVSSFPPGVLYVVTEFPTGRKKTLAVVR